MRGQTLHALPGLTEELGFESEWHFNRHGWWRTFFQQGGLTPEQGRLASGLLGQDFEPKGVKPGLSLTTVVTRIVEIIP